MVQQTRQLENLKPAKQMSINLSGGRKLIWVHEYSGHIGGVLHNREALHDKLEESILGLKILSALVRVSTLQGCPLSEVPLYFHDKENSSCSIRVF